MTARRSGCRSGGWEGFFVNGADRWRGFNLKLGVISPLFLQGQIGQSGGNNLDSTRLDSARLDSACELLCSAFSDTRTKRSGAWWPCFMFASCEQIDHFGGSFRGSQARANPVKDIWATLEGTIPRRLHSVCLPRCTCHIRLSLLEKLLRRRVFEEAFIVCLLESSEITQAPTDGSLFCFSLCFQGAAQ